MEHKEDIGKLIEKRLTEAKQTPKENIWDKINASLDKEMKRKKRVLFLWTTGMSSLLLVLLLIYFTKPTFFNNLNTINDSPVINNTSSERNTLKTDNSIEDDLTTNVDEADSLKATIENLKEDDNTNITTDSYTVLKGSKNELNITSEEIKTKRKDKLQNTEKQTTILSKTKYSPKEEIIDNGYTIDTNYRYYNSKNNETIITTDKKIIDSLLKQNEKRVDTIPNTKDSVKQ
jgi:hypothetical protein